MPTAGQKEQKKYGLKFIKACPIDKLTPNPRNPRRNDHAVEAVARSIEKFGFIAPIIVDENLNICAGHTRYKAAIQQGLSHVPVIVAQQLVGEGFTGYNSKYAKPYPKARAGSIDADASAIQVDQGGSSPTPALQDSAAT